MSSSESARQEGQWVHAALFQASVPAACRLSLGEGATPLEPAPLLGAQLGIPDLWLKREDISPTGSHKARSLGLLVADLMARGGAQAVISSSGNAALAAAAFCSEAGIRLLSLISPRTPEVKVRGLVAQGQLVVASEKPVEMLHHAASSWDMTDLRASTNPLGPTAYRGIAAELSAEGQWDAVFTFSNSGATALGLQEGFQMLAGGGSTPQIHPVEGWPGGELTRPWYGREEHHPPAGIGDLGARRSRLAPAVRRAVRLSGGRGWRVTGAELQRMRELTSVVEPMTSWEGLAALAAAAEAVNQGARLGRVVVLLTGAADQLDLRPSASIRDLAPMVETFEELDALLTSNGFRRS